MAAWGMPVQASRAHSCSVKMLLAQQDQWWEVQPVAGKMEPQVEFIGWQIKPKQEVGVAEELDEESLVTIHITQVALGDAASAERHTVFITNEKGKFAIGTLDRDKPHFSVDFMAADSDLRFSHTGPSDVYVTGYKTRSTMMPEDYPYFDDADPSSDDEEDDEEEPPRAVPLNSKRRAALIAAQRAKEEEEEDDEDNEEDDEDFDEQERLLDAQEFSDLDGDDESDDEDESEDDEDDEEEGVAGAMRGFAKAPNGMRTAMEADEDEDDDEEDDENDEEGDEEELVMGDQRNTAAAINRQFAAAREADEENDDDESDDEEDDDEDDEFSDDEDDEDEDEDDIDEPAAMANAAGKRPMMPKTPQPAKKAKVDAKEPKSAPAKMGKGGGEVAELQAKIVNALKDKGPMPLSQLGGLIKRPAGAPKLKKILEDNAAVFKIDGSLNVSLA